jgi:hypothetical protein
LEAARLGRRRRSRPLFTVLVTIGWLVVLAATFTLGYLVARYGLEEALAELDTLRAEAALLSEEVARGRDERIRLERAHQMDREAKRQAQESLTDLQGERLLLQKRLSYLQRLVRDGSKGVVVVKEVRLAPGDESGRYRFDLILSQLVPQDFRSKGTAQISVVVSRDDKEQSLTLDELPGSTSAAIPFDFEHFQFVSGEIVLPGGAVPERFVVEIEPSGELLSSSSEAFLWPDNPECAGVNLNPAVSAEELTEDSKVE